MPNLMASSSTSSLEHRDVVLERASKPLPAWYSPWVHLALSLSAGAAAIVWLATRPTDMRPWAYLAIPMAITMANAIEYLVHRFPMHRRRKLTDRFFRGHTLIHHRYFDHRTLEFEQTSEAYFVLTTAHTTGLSIGLMLVLSLAITRLLGPDVAAVACITWIVYMLALELVHLAFHLPHTLQRRWPLRGHLFQWLRMHHRLHHDPHIMTSHNFNIVFPLTDWLLGTRLAPRQANVRTGDPANG